MGIGNVINATLNGTLWTAFQGFCARKGIKHSSEGVRALVRETPEFRRLERALMVADSGNGGEPGDSGAQDECKVGCSVNI